MASAADSATLTSAPISLEHLGDGLPRRDIVVHDQDAQVLDRASWPAPWTCFAPAGTTIAPPSATTRWTFMSGSVTEKVAPFPGPGALGLDRPAVLLDEMAHDRQAEAQAAVHAGVRGVVLGEAIEDVRQEPGLDPRPGVAHLEAGAPVHRRPA